MGGDYAFLKVNKDKTSKDDGTEVTFTLANTVNMTEQKLPSYMQVKTTLNYHDH